MTGCASWRPRPWSTSVARIDIDLKKPTVLEELRLADLELGHDNSGWSSDWKVETVRVEYTLDGSTYWLLRESPLLGWVKSDEGDGSARVAI